VHARILRDPSPLRPSPRPIHSRATGLRGEKKSDSFSGSPPAGSAVFLISGVRFGATRWGWPWNPCWSECTGPSLFRCWCPGGGVEAAAAAPPWNKSLRPRLRLDSAHSGAVEGSVREESMESWGCFTGTRLLPVLDGSCVGVCSPALQPGKVCVSVMLCSGMAVLVAVVGWVDCFSVLAVRRRRGRFHDHRSSGCVPGRYAFSVVSCCGSCQRLRAMEFLLVLGSLTSCSGDGFCHGGGRRRRRAVLPESAEDPQGLVVISFLFRVFCANICGQLSPMYGSRWCLYGHGLVLVCLV